jgi:hypothetical protein
MHKAVDNLNEDELMHGEWLNKFRRYVDKVKTASGKWRYIYPEDLKKKAENVKRDVSYKARNIASKVTGKNKTFNEKTSYDSHPYPYERQNEKAGRGMKYYHINKKLREQREQNFVDSSNNKGQSAESHKIKNIKYKQTDYSKVMDKNEKRKKLASYMKAANKDSTYSKLSSSTKDGIKRNLNSNIPDDSNIKVTYKSKYRSKFQTTTPTEKFGKLKTERKQWNDSLKRYRKLTTKEKRINKKGR